MQFAQDVIGNMARSFGFAVDVNGHIRILATHFLNEGTQAQNSRVEVGAGRELLIVNRQNKGTGA